MTEEGMKWGVYLRQTSRHKWRLATVVFNPDLAAGQKEALVTQAHSAGQKQTEGQVIVYGSGVPIQETL